MEKTTHTWGGAKFESTNQFTSRARVIDERKVEIMAPDGECYEILCAVGIGDENWQKYYLRILEAIFDKHYEACKGDITAFGSGFMVDCMRLGINYIGGPRPRTEPNDRQRIGKRIREIRESKGMDAKQLAQQTGIDPANISRIENGKYAASIDALSKIARAFDMKIDFVEKKA